MDENEFKQLRTKIEDLDSLLIGLSNDEYGDLNDIEGGEDLRNSIDDLQYQTAEWLEHNQIDEEQMANTRIESQEATVLAYVFNSDGMHDYPIEIKNTPECIASFIVQHPNNDCSFTDLADNFICSSMGEFLGFSKQNDIDREQLVNELVSMQTGEKSPIPMEELDLSGIQEMN